MTSSSPEGAGDMAAARGALDEALVALRSLIDPQVDVREIEREIAAALVHAYRAIAAGGDAAAFYEEKALGILRVRRGLAALQRAPTEDPMVTQVASLVAVALRGFAEARQLPTDAPVDLPRLPPQGSRTVDAPTILRATKRVPTLLSLQRAVLYPAIPLAEVEPEEEAPPPPELPPPPVIANAEQLQAFLAEVEAELHGKEQAEEDEEGDEAEEQDGRGAMARPPLGPAEDDVCEREYVGVQVSESDVLTDRARSSFEDLAMLSLMRRPGEGQTWVGRSKPEERLLARLDAIVACGVWVLPRLVKILEERPLPDADMTWAAIFVFGSIAGADALDQAMRIARVAPLGVHDVQVAVTDAISLAPHPGFDDAMRAWLADLDPVRRCVAVTTLARRRTIRVEQATAAAGDPDERVVAAAAAALAFPFGRPDLTGLVEHPSEAVAHAAITSAIQRRQEVGVLRALQLTREGFGVHAEAVMFLAVGGGPDAIEPLLAAASSPDPAPVVLEALGWCGSVGAIDLLLSATESEVPAVKVAALDALQRITDASLTDEVPDPSYPDDGQPFVRAWSPPSITAKLCGDVAAWRGWWKKHKKGADPRGRYRFGHRWTLMDDVWELECPWSGRRARWFAYLELVARTGHAMPFDPDEFVARQEEKVREWRREIESRDPRVSMDPWMTSYER